MKWTEEKIKTLEEKINLKLSHKDIALFFKDFNVTENSIRLKCQKLKLKSKNLKPLKVIENIKCENCEVLFKAPLLENRKFCSHSCSAISNNSKRVSTKNNFFNCKNCGKESILNKNSKGLYCSKSCQMEMQQQERVEKWKLGLICAHVGEARTIARWLRKHILDKNNNSCIRCGWNKLHPVDNKPLVEINHIDGNAENNDDSNLEVLCPNCHSMTHNFRARNKKSTRVRNKK